MVTGPGHESGVTAQGSRVSGHGQLSELKVRGQGSEVKGQGSLDPDP